MFFFLQMGNLKTITTRKSAVYSRARDPAPLYTTEVEKFRLVCYGEMLSIWDRQTEPQTTVCHRAKHYLPQLVPMV